MGPLAIIAISSQLFSGLFNGVSNFANGHYSRRLQQKLHDENRADATLRFDKDINLRSAQFVFTQVEAERVRAQRVLERMEDFERLAQRDKQGRSFNSLSRVFLASPDGWYVHDPYAHAHPGVKSLRILLQRPKGVPEQYQAEIEREINSAIRDYTECGGGHPIHFPTGLWADGAQPGSWVASELHAWDQTIPTLVLRISPTREGKFFAQADMFGFPMGNSAFEQNIDLGHLPNDPAQIGQVLSLVALGSADMYFLSCHAKMPLLPGLLAQYLTQDPAAAADPALPAPVDALRETIIEIVRGYQKTVNVLLAEMPEVGLFAALQMAEALTALPDKTYAIEQLRQIEAMTAGIVGQQPELVQKLRDLYTQSGAAEDAARLAKTAQQGQISAAAKKNKLEAHI